MDANEISYALAKQLDRAHTLQSTYGDIQLDAELVEAIDKAIRPILNERLARMRVQERARSI